MNKAKVFLIKIKKQEISTLDFKIKANDQEEAETKVLEYVDDNNSFMDWEIEKFAPIVIGSKILSD